MRKEMILATVLIIAAFIVSTPAYSGNMKGSAEKGGMDHGTDGSMKMDGDAMKNMDHSGGKEKMIHGKTKEKMVHGNSMENMDHGSKMGKMIHHSSSDGYNYEYRLMDMRKNLTKMKDMPGMEKMNATHHLMVNISNGAEESMNKAKVGFMVQAPDGTNSKVMAMGMGDGFGADLDLSQKGTYLIKMRMVSGKKKMQDKFTYKNN